MAGAHFMIGLLLTAWLMPAADAEVLARAEASCQAGVQAMGTPAEKKHFQATAEHYEELCRRGVHNALLYRNLGNAYFLADDLPHAILAYRRGLRLDPCDRDLHACLAHAREQVVHDSCDPIGRPTIDHWPPWLPRPSAGFCLGAALFLYTLACLALTRWFMRRRHALLVVAAAAFALAGLSAFSVVRQARELQRDLEQPLLVLAGDDIFLRKGNGYAYPPSHDVPLHRGFEARLLYQRGTWLQIILPGGEVGWVPRNAVVLD